MPDIVLSGEQQTAKDAILQWLDEWENREVKDGERLEDIPLNQLATFDSSTYRVKREPPPIFKLHGYAGTGKTTIIRSVIQTLTGVDNLLTQDDVLFGAYTGKASLVMQRQKLPAKTIHSTIFKVVEPSKQLCNELFEKVKAASGGEKQRLQAELDEAKQVSFDLRTPDDCELTGCRLYVIDEYSMLSDDLIEDVLTFGVPVLFLGDPGQLPPINGVNSYAKDGPDIMLTEIHRQAQDNPIIDYATRARNGIHIPYSVEERAKHVNKNELLVDEILEFDQILTGKNVTRRDLNQRIRHLKKRTSKYPEVGEKLICLRNSYVTELYSEGKVQPIKVRIFNGQLFECVSVGELRDSSIELGILPEETVGTPAEPYKVYALRAHFDMYQDKDAIKNVKSWEYKEAHEFDFGYAITVHKSQGSQWDNVILFDDKFLVWKKLERRNWLYTGITRAAERIIIAD